MKAISIRQPYAWLIVNGFKDIENREWYTKHRGDILIHAAKGCTVKEWDEAMEFIKKVCPGCPVPSLDRIQKGGIVGLARIVDCVKKSSSPWFVGSWGFVLNKPYPIPFRPMRGMLGIFNVNELGLPEEISK